MWQKCSVLPYDRFEKDYGRQLPVHFEAVVTLGKCEILGPDSEFWMEPWCFGWLRIVDCNMVVWTRSHAMVGWRIGIGWVKDRGAGYWRSWGSSSLVLLCPAAKAHSCLQSGKPASQIWTWPPLEYEPQRQGQSSKCDAVWQWCAFLIHQPEVEPDRNKFVLLEELKTSWGQKQISDRIWTRQKNRS